MIIGILLEQNPVIPPFFALCDHSILHYTNLYYLLKGPNSHCIALAGIASICFKFYTDFQQTNTTDTDPGVSKEKKIVFPLKLFCFKFGNPKVTVHKCAETIQGRKLYEEIR